MTPAELKDWRKQQGISQEKLAALLGIDEMTVSRWERGQNAIPSYLALALETINRAHAVMRGPTEPHS